MSTTLPADSFAQIRFLHDECGLSFDQIALALCRQRRQIEVWYHGGTEISPLPQSDLGELMKIISILAPSKLTYAAVGIWLCQPAQITGHKSRPAAPVNWLRYHKYDEVAARAHETANNPEELQALREAAQHLQQRVA